MFLHRVLIEDCKVVTRVWWFDPTKLSEVKFTRKVHEEINQAFPNETYTYRIESVNQEGVAGPSSEDMFATTDPLPSNFNFAIEAGENRLVLNWSELPDYGGFGYERYEILKDEEIV